jgi:hypothetical protein
MDLDTRVRRKEVEVDTKEVEVQTRFFPCEQQDRTSLASREYESHDSIRPCSNEMWIGM